MQSAPEYSSFGRGEEFLNNLLKMLKPEQHDAHVTERALATVLEALKG